MVDPDRRPTAQEIEELIDLVRRDPGSPAFIDLGEAYLALGRPRDAVKIGNVGLEASPDSLEGRVMLARAHAAMHQWKEAQGELLRVVKVDRSNRQGFALLGEVLMRRSDFERAVPVLQHAQNLDPTSPHILSMLKRARSGQVLEPPPPIPTPLPPRGETDNNFEIDHRRSMPNMGASAQVPVAAPNARTIGLVVPQAAPAHPQAPAAFPDASPAGFTIPSSSASDHGAPRAARPSVPPPQPSIEGVRPRIVARERPANAAAASLRQSAAVGETYLNDLLTGGLLDVAGVHTENEFDLRPDRRWGRSTRRAFIFLFVVLVLGIGGGGTWYWWSEKQKDEAVARLQTESKQAIGDGDFEGLERSIKKLTESLEKDNRNLLSFSYYVETAGLEALLYGTEADRVDRAYKSAKDEIKPGKPGYRELVIGKAALELSRLGTGDGDAQAIASASKTTLADVAKSLDEQIAKDPSDKWAMWLKGRAQLAAGERKEAKSSFKSAADGPTGLVLAMIDHANMLVDDGALDEALAEYQSAITIAKTPRSQDPNKPAPEPTGAKKLSHPLAVIGRALGRAEAQVQVNEALDELNTQLVANIGPRVAAYKALAMSLANYGIEDYPKAAEALTKATATPPNEVRFWARVSWAHYVAGDFAAAATARARIVWYGKGPAEDDPAVKLVDAGLALASGTSQKAFDIAAKLDGVRAQTIRIYALLDLGRAKEALAEADEVLTKAPENQEAMILREQARMIAGDAKERAEASDALERLARRARSKLGRHAHGIALAAIGNAKDAKAELEEAVTDITVESPNPLAYRTRTALAELALAANDLDGAGKALDAALAANPGYFPALALQAKIVLRNNEPDRALDLLAPIFNEADAITPNLQLTLAEALVVSKKTSAKQKEQARKILEDIKDKIQPPAEVSRVAALIDPALPAELGLPEPPPDPNAAPTAPAPAPKKKSPPRRRRRR